MTPDNDIRRLASLVIFLGLFVGFNVFAQDSDAGSEPEASTETAETAPTAPTAATAATAATDTEVTESKAIKGRFLPAPFVITEPAIGKGLGFGVIYFHGKDAVERPRIQSANSIGNTARRGKPPPTATAAGGFYTDNETAGVALAHSRSMADDKYRIVGVLASMDIHATYYEQNQGYNFNLDAGAIYARGQRRMGDSNVFLGMSAALLDGDIGFDVGSGAAPVGVLQSGFTDVGVAGSAIYDSRDDSMMPGTGQLYDLTIWRHDDFLGSDFDYTNTRIKVLSFHQLAEKFFLGLRLDVANNNGDAPFFAIPFVGLRGIPALRYQGDTAGAVEIEGRYSINPRWSAVAFAGAGFVDWDDSSIPTEDDIYTYGFGARFQLFTEQNVWIGLDIAEGPEGSNWYIQIGHPW